MSATKKALAVGIDHYAHLGPLRGCVNDAHSVTSVLESHADGSVNFDVMRLTAHDGASAVHRKDLKRRIEELFTGDPDIALLYFAGHGHVESTGGYLCTSDSRDGDDGLPLGEILTLADKSDARNRVIILDSCFAGAAGDHPVREQVELMEGTTILAAASKEQYASEVNGSGVFTALLVDAMKGAAANLVGDVSPGSVYAHIDQSLGAWEQRPVFKTNVKSFVSLRKVQPPIRLADLRRITEFFPSAGHQFPLDPSFEPEPTGRPAGAAAPHAANVAKFAVLQAYNRVNLVVPVDAPHMWHAAIESKGCKLTVLGEHYRRLVEKKRL